MLVQAARSARCFYVARGGALDHACYRCAMGGHGGSGGDGCVVGAQAAAGSVCGWKAERFFGAGGCGLTSCGRPLSSRRGVRFVKISWARITGTRRALGAAGPTPPPPLVRSPLPPLALLALEAAGGGRGEEGGGWQGSRAYTEWWKTHGRVT